MLVAPALANHKVVQMIATLEPVTIARYPRSGTVYAPGSKTARTAAAGTTGSQKEERGVQGNKELERMRG